MILKFTVFDSLNHVKYEEHLLELICEKDLSSICPQILETAIKLYPDYKLKQNIIYSPVYKTYSIDIEEDLFIHCYVREFEDTLFIK